MTDEQAVTEGGGKVSVNVWTTAKSGPQWRVRLTEIDDALADVVVVRAFNRVGDELVAMRQPFEGEEPMAA